MTSLYDMSVPVYIRALENLVKVLEAGEKWAKENNVELSTLAEARIAPDMNVGLLQMSNKRCTHVHILRFHLFVCSHFHIRFKQQAIRQR